MSKEEVYRRKFSNPFATNDDEDPLLPPFDWMPQERSLNGATKEKLDE